MRNIFFKVECELSGIRLLSVYLSEKWLKIGELLTK